MAEREGDGLWPPEGIVRGPITYIRSPDENGVPSWYTVGAGGVDEIRAFTKTGMYADLHWIGVIKDGRVIFEIDASHLLGIFYG